MNRERARRREEIAVRLLRIFAVPMTQLRRLSDGELRAALIETAELVSRLDGAE